MSVKADQIERIAPYRFKPGQSGNPRGRVPELERLEAVVERVLRERALAPRDFKLAPGKKLRRVEIIVRNLVCAAEAGSIEATRILLDRLWPRPQRIELDVPLEALADAEDALERRIQKAIAARRAAELH